MHIVCYYEIAVFSVQLILACGTAICTHLLPHFWKSEVKLLSWLACCWNS